MINPDYNSTRSRERQDKGNLVFSYKLHEQVRWAHLSRLRFPALLPKENSSHNQYNKSFTKQAC